MNKEIEHLVFKEGPRRVGPFSHAVKSGGFLFVTGQMPTLQNDPTKMGTLLAQSHESLKSDFEVSCPELDRLVQIAEKLDAIGSRMMGGGFGGSTINLVRRQNKQQFLEQIKLLHFEMTGNDIDAWAVDPVNGAAASNIVDKI